MLVPPFMVTDCNFVRWIDEIALVGMVASVILLQPSNALIPMLVTLLGIVTEVSAVQPENALSPMLVTPSGMVIEVSEVQS